MKRTLAILAVPVLGFGSIAAIGYASCLAGGTFGPLLGWTKATGFILCAAVLCAAFGAEAIHRLMDYIATSEPGTNRRPGTMAKRLRLLSTRARVFVNRLRFRRALKTLAKLQAPQPELSGTTNAKAAWLLLGAMTAVQLILAAILKLCL
jgi:hypothetical protein